MADGHPFPLVDVNLLLWAHHAQFPRHERAFAWWRDLLSDHPRVGVPWPVALAFVRISTHPRVLERPATIEDAWAEVGRWLDRANVWTPVPTERHRGVLGPLLIGGQASGNHTTDAHLAALAIEWGLQLLSADRDFARYPGLSWRNPLATTGPAG